MNNKKVLKISLPEYFDFWNISKMKDAWEKTVSMKPDIIGVECSNCNYIDSSAIGAIVKFYKCSIENNIELHFIDLNSKLSYIFEMTKINKVISIISNEQFTQFGYLENINYSDKAGLPD